MAATNHGLTVYTDRNAGDAQRLIRPVGDSQRQQTPLEDAITNCFNDAVSVLTFHTIYGLKGHSGVDFGCGADVDVNAMYGGEVIARVNNWAAGGKSSGNWVKIRSCTNAEQNSGFEHTYLHLNSVDVSLGQYVKKGQKIGVSGGTGGVVAHLHVHLAPFDSRGEITSSSSDTASNLDESAWTMGDLLVTPVRVKGRMNFLCFMVPDTLAYAPDITVSALATPPRKVLSPRAFAAKIPLFITPLETYNSAQTYAPDTPGQTRTFWVDGKEVACYVVLAEQQSAEHAPQPVTWYQIQHTGMEGWVPSRGLVGSHTNVAWVQVEEAATPVRPSKAFITTKRRGADSILSPVYANPDPTSEVPSLGTLTADKDYQITATHLDPKTEFEDVTDPIAILARRRWWQIDLAQDSNFAADCGWVRSDGANECGPTEEIPAGWPPAVRNLAAVRERDGIRVTWDAPELPPNSQAPLPEVTGYRIWRYQGVSTLFPAVGPVTWDEAAGTISSLDMPVVPDYTLLYYEVASLCGTTVGAVSGFVSVTAGGATLFAPPPFEELYTGPSVSVMPATDGPGQIEANQHPFGEIFGEFGSWLVGTWEEAVGVFDSQPNLLENLQDTTRRYWVQIRKFLTGNQRTRRTRAVQSGYVYGWVPMQYLEGGTRWRDQVADLPDLPLLRVSHWVTQGLNVRSGPGTEYDPPLQTLAADGVWYSVVGQNADPATWWRIEISMGLYGWVHAGHVITSSASSLTGVPVQIAGGAVTELEPGGTQAPGTETGAATGDYINLTTNRDGIWSVSKSGTTVKATFSSSRSPIQYYARENPQPQFVVPEGFRPTLTVPHEATGVHVHEDGTDYALSPQATFDLTITPNGEMRYVDNSQVDLIGYLRYTVTDLQWETLESLAVPARPALTQQGNFDDLTVHENGAWDLSRLENEMTGTISSTRSSVQYAADNNMILFTLPEIYRPTVILEISVTGTHVNEDGTDMAGSPTQTFDLRIWPAGLARYVNGTHLDAVGYLRYSVDVSWHGERLAVQVPTEPLNLAGRSRDDTWVSLDWDAPAEDGGGNIQGYHIEVWATDQWAEQVADTGSGLTQHIVTDLNPYTRYTFRVRARNAQGLGPASTALTVTTNRETPGAPSSLWATATHEVVTLRWGPGTGPVTGYRIERQEPGGSWSIVIYDTGETTRIYVDRTVASATAYEYRVRAFNHGFQGQWSWIEPVTTAAAPTIPSSPTNLAVVPGADSQLQLSWSAPTGTGDGVTGYRIERSPDEMPRTWTDVVADTRSTSLTWDESGLAADAVLAYRVSALNSIGVSVPAAEATGRTRPRLQLDQLIPYPLTAYAEPRLDAAANATFVFFLPARAYDLVAQVPGPDGWWRVLLFGRSGQGPFWVPALAGTAVGTTVNLPQPPAAPETFEATLSAGTITVSWNAPLTGASVTGYRLWRQVDTGAWAVLESSLSDTVLTHPDTGVSLDQVYRYRLQALSLEGPGRMTAEQALAVMAAPAAPDPVQTLAVAATPTTLRLGWARSATGGLPTGYRVGWAPTGSTPLAETTVIATSHELKDLDPNMTYDLVVTAFNQEGVATATAGTGTTLPVAPDAPTSLRAAPGADSQMQLTWQAPGYEGTYPITGYRIERSTDVSPRAWMEVVPDTGHTDLTWSDMDLQADTQYHYQVSARSLAGVGSPSAEAMGHTRPQLTLSSAAGYPLFARAWPAATAPASHIWSVHETTVFDLVGQGRGVGDWWWRVLIFGASTPGPYWVPAAAGTVMGRTANLPSAPGVPRALTFTTPGHVVLSWTAPATGGPVTGYRIWRQADAAAFAVLGPDLAASLLTFTDISVLAGTIYQYQVQALSAGGPGIPTPVVSVAVPAAPTTPGQPNKAQTGPASLQLRWGSVATATDYEIQLYETRYDPISQTNQSQWVTLSEPSPTAIATVADATVDVTLTRTGTLATLQGLPTTYAWWFLQLRALNAGGASAWSNYSSVNNQPLLLHPMAPTGLTGQRTGADSASLTWNDVPNADYLLYLWFPADDQGAAGWDFLPWRGVGVAFNGATATVTDLPLTETYWHFQVTAYNTANRQSVTSLHISILNPDA